MVDVTLSLFDQLSEDEKQSLSQVFKSRHETIRNTNDVLIQTISELRNRKWRTHESIWNACLFLNTVAYDHSVLLFELAYERDNWKRRLIARHLCVLLFETAEDLASVFGRSFYKSLETLGVSADLRDEFRSRIKRISALWNDNRSMLKDVRLICGAHRDHDAMLMHQTIDGIDLFEVMRISVTLGNILNSIGLAAQSILAATSAIAPPEIGQE